MFTRTAKIFRNIRRNQHCFLSFGKQNERKRVAWKHAQQNLPIVFSRFHWVWASSRLQSWRVLGCGCISFPAVSKIQINTRVFKKNFKFLIQNGKKWCQVSEEDVRFLWEILVRIFFDRWLEIRFWKEIIFFWKNGVTDLVYKFYFKVSSDFLKIWENGSAE